MKYLASSITSVSIIQSLATLVTLIGLFFVDITGTSLMVLLISYFLYSGIGISMMMHRYWTHKSFEFKFSWMKWIFNWFALMAGRGSTLGWVYVHREHHAFSDTERDPHSPIHKGWRVFFFHMIGYKGTLNKKVVRDLLTREQVNIDKYYVAIVALGVIVLTTISPWLAFWGWAVPITLVKFAWSSFIYFGHISGYQNHETGDNSKNCWPYALLMWGEGWHNNHHANPRAWNLREKWWEIDIISYVIRLVKK
jgi:stearoyl-CoA desaturase (delta-9 desaturase)